ncbi:hypothetical protein A3709_00500 [Halioglobus sp. HI00S01]|nr:hypothetical protein A3709_00500 [Halioglobus sp. HI00S01]
MRRRARRTAVPDPVFRAFQRSDEAACLAIFDDNCPMFSAPYEREDYLAFLRSAGTGYEVCTEGETTVGAYGIYSQSGQEASLNWILLSPHHQGSGLGSAIMTRAIAAARQHGASAITIAASHKSAPFFARFGANFLSELEHGWGPDMHRVEMTLAI